MRHIWCPLLTAKGAAKLEKYFHDKTTIIVKEVEEDPLHGVP